MNKKNRNMVVAGAVGVAALLYLYKGKASASPSSPTPPVSLTALTQLYNTARTSNDRAAVVRAASQLEAAGRADLATELRRRAASLS